MTIRFRADNIGSLLRPADLLVARTALREGHMDESQVRAIEDRSILTALEMQKGAGVQIFTDGEYRRDIFTADITKAMDGLVPGKRKKATCSISSVGSCAGKGGSRPTKRRS